jgi:hypothetical protein
VKTRVIPFSGRYFKRNTYPPLTSKMVVSLLEAIKRQNKKIPFGPSSIKGSLTTLIQRGLIIRKRITFKGHEDYQWQVTSEAIIKLNQLGIKG